MIEQVMNVIGGSFPLSAVTGNPYGTVEKSGMEFCIDTYRMGDVGNICTIRMNAMGGQMTMEAVIVTADGRDVPLFSSDVIHAAGNHTCLVEFYDTMLEFLSEEQKAGFRAVKKLYDDLPKVGHEPRWYDGILYDFSLAAVGEETGIKADTIVTASAERYVDLLKNAPVCDPASKRAKTREYVDNLCSQGGPAAEQFVRLLGADAAKELFTKYVFCCG